MPLLNELDTRHTGYTLVDDNILFSYDQGVHDMKNFKIPEHYHFLEYLNRDAFKGNQGKYLMERILSEPSGLESLVLEKRLPLNAAQWMYEPLRSETMQITCSWMHVPGTVSQNN